MKLTQEHRKALIFKLNELIEQIDLQNRILSKSQSKENTNISDLTECWIEVDLFLLEQTKKQVENALIDQEIDF